MRYTATALFLAVTLLFVGCDSDTEEVVLYTSADDYVARQVIAAFEEETGITVRFVGDIEAKKTTGLANRLRDERNNPQADVFWSSEIFQTILLAEEGLFEEHVSDATTDWPREFRDGQRRWFGFAGRARVIVYAPDRVSPDQVPQSWMALANPRFQGRIVMADPRFGTTGGHLGAMQTYWESIGKRKQYETFLNGLAVAQTRMLPSGNAGVVDAVARGEADLGMTDTDDVWAARANGLNVELVYPRHHPEPGTEFGGTLLIPNTVARVKGGPNPDNAAILIDYLLSPEVELMLADTVSHNVPIGIPIPDAFEQYAVPNPLKVDWEDAAAARESAVEAAMRIVGGSAGNTSDSTGAGE